jgi:hypothetical protein
MIATNHPYVIDTNRSRVHFWTQERMVSRSSP